MDFQNELYEAQIQSEVDKRLADIVRNDPKAVIRAYAAENERLQIELDSTRAELVETKHKWSKFLDSEGLMDVSEVAERIRVPYIDPSGKRQHMGLHYFCKLLSIDGILLHKSSGYGLYKNCPKVIRDNSKVINSVQNGYNKSSVKFNARALEWLDDKYSADERVWHSTGDKAIYHD